MRAFRVFGIDIYIDYSWLLIFALILWSTTFGYFPAGYPGRSSAAYLGVGLASTLLFFASVLLHELSHSLVANQHGVRVERITLFIFGGVSHMTRESPNPAVEVRIAAAGPLASFLLGAAFLGVAWLAADAGESLWVGMARFLGSVNIMLGVFNMLPGFPLDGGRVFRAMSWGRSGSRVKATYTAAAWGKGLGWTLMGAGALLAIKGTFVQGLWMILIGLFLKEAAERERRQAVLGDVLAGVTVAQAMTGEPISIPAHAPVEEALQAFFLRQGYGGYPVTRDGRVLGVVSLADLTRCATEERSRTPVSQIMTPLQPDQMTWPQEDLVGAMRKMAAAGVSRLPVLADSGGGQLVGLLTLQAVTRQIKLREIAAGPRA